MSKILSTIIKIAHISRQAEVFAQSPNLSGGSSSKNQAEKVKVFRQPAENLGAMTQQRKDTKIHPELASVISPLAWH